MKTENIILIAGLGFIAYWLTRRNPTIIDNSNGMTNTNKPIDLETDDTDSKTIVLDMRPKTKREAFVDPFRKGYNTSKFATVAPPSVTVRQTNSYDF